MKSDLPNSCAIKHTYNAVIATLLFMYTMDVGFFRRLALVTIVLVNNGLLARVITKESITGVRDLETPDVQSSINTDTGSRNVSRSIISPVVTSEVTSKNAGVKSDGNSTKVVTERGGISNSSELSTGEKPSAYETESGTQSNNTEPGSYDVPITFVQSEQPEPVVSKQTVSYNSQLKVIPIKSKYNSSLFESNAVPFQMQNFIINGSSLQLSDSKADPIYNDTESNVFSKEAITGSSEGVTISKEASVEQLPGIKIESYESSNRSSIKPTSVSNSSIISINEQLPSSEMESYDRFKGSKTNQTNEPVIPSSEQSRVNGSEMESYPASNGSAADSKTQSSSQVNAGSEEKAIPEVESYNRSVGSKTESTNNSYSSNVESKEKPSSVDKLSYNISAGTGFEMGSAGRISSPDTEVSYKAKGLDTGYSYKTASSSSVTGQENYVDKVRGISVTSKSKVKGYLNVKPNKATIKSIAEPIAKTSRSDIVSGSYPNNTNIGGHDTGYDPADVDFPSGGLTESQNEAAERTSGPDVGEQPEIPEGIQQGPCERFPFRIEGTKVIFDVEMNCQLSVNLDVAQQFKANKPNNQRNAAANLFEVKTLGGTNAVAGSCPKLRTFVSRNGIVHIQTSPNCHIIIHPDRLTAGQL